jgi:histone arginine demethylase JMJD6
LEWYPWFEQQNVPAILEGCCTEWKAMTNCQWNPLVQRFGEYDWRFSDTHGATMTLATYHKYVHSIEGQSDDAPLAVYDSQLDTDDRRIILEEDYHVPKCFAAPDLLECLDEIHNEENDDENDGNSDTVIGPCRPPYRWILMGPARSGTGLHVDPLGTHAWVSLVQGLKRWVLFPYGTDPTSIGMPPNPNDPAINSVIWFQDYYETFLRQHPGAVEVLQYPGETVYVPAGWPHLVLNLEASVAITQNYATEYPTLERLVSAVKTGEPDMVGPWLNQLKLHRPDLFHEEDGDD